MPIALPEFRDSRLYELSACALLHADNESRLSWLDDSIGVQSHYELADNRGGAWVRLLIHKEGDGTHGHLHFDVARDDHFEEISVLNTVELETLLEYTEHFIGQEVQLSPSARFRIPIADIPKLGIVSTLLGVTTQACGAEMSLVGAALSISDETFDYVRWSRDGDNVTAYLEADTETIVDDQYLTNIESLMIGGFDCFVLEITAASGGDEDSKNEDNGESESTRDVAAS